MNATHKLLFPILLASIFIGACSKYEKNANETKEPAEFSSVRADANPKVPDFTLACSTGNGQPWYRIVSKDGAIYFASILNEANIKGSKKSFDVKVTDREINAEMRNGEDESIYYLSIDRSTLYAISKHFSSVSLYPPDGYSQMGMNCSSIEDEAIYEQLKQGYESRLSESQVLKKAYESRPNKI